jgi:hypothetical protein
MFLALALAGTLAFADKTVLPSTQVTGAAADFCSDPVGVICVGGTDAVRKDRLKFIEQFKMAAREKFKNEPRSETSVRRLLRETTKPAFDQFVQKDVPKIRQSMILAIKLSPLSTKQKKEFLQQLEGETVHSYIDLIDSSSKDLMSRGVDAFSSCGPEGLSPLAQAEDNEKARVTKKQKLVLCDSLFLRDGLKPEGALAAGFMIAAHEMSHVMSAYWEPEMYARLRSCLNQEEGRGAVAEYLQALKNHGEKVDDAYEAQTYANQDWFMNMQMEEISADYWARKAIGAHLVSVEMTQGDKIEFLRSSYGYFCGYESHGTHPSGRFRIQFMGQDSVIRRALGCKPAVPAACEL